MSEKYIFTVPVYNVEGNIRNAINTIYDLVKKGVNISRTIVIDDGSTDRTPEILTEMRQKYPTIETITHPGNMGIEKVFESGLKMAAQTKRR